MAEVYLTPSADPSLDNADVEIGGRDGGASQDSNILNTTPGPGERTYLYVFDTVSEMRNYPVNGLPNGQVGYVRDVGFFEFSNADGTPDGLDTFQANPVGLWSKKVSANAVATWALDSQRYFAVDPVNGNDTNIGYSDVSLAAAGNVAKKTIAGLRTVLPTLGAGRMAKVGLRNGTYLDTDGVAEALELDLAGYAEVLVRGTLDFSDNETDRIVCGFVQSLAGPGGGGTWTVVAGATVNSITVLSGALTAEPALLGDRIRFSGNVSPALANVTATIHQNTGTVITLLDDLAAAPAGGDTFVIEHAGVVVDRIIGRNFYSTKEEITGDGRGITIVGVRSTANADPAIQIVGGSRVTLVGVKNPNNVVLYVADFGYLNMADTYTDVDSTTTYRVGARTVAGRCVFTRNTLVEGSFYSRGTGINNWINCGIMQLNGYYGSEIRLDVCGHGTTGDSLAIAGGVVIGNGGISTSRRARCAFINGLLSSFAAYGVSILAGGSIGIDFQGDGCNIRLEDVVGAGVMTDIGIRAQTAARNCSINIGLITACTLTGTNGDIRAADGSVIIDYADLTITNINDTNNNNWVGTGGNIVAKCIVLRHTVAAVAVGQIVRSSGVSGQVGNAQDVSVAAAAGPLFVAVSSPAANADGYYTEASHGAWHEIEGVNTPGAQCYIGNTARFTATAIPTVGNIRRRIGHIETTNGGTMARVYGGTEQVGTVSDGVTP